MPSFYGKILQAIRHHYSSAELAEFPDYNWVTFNIIVYLNGEVPAMPPLIFLKTEWALYFNKVCAHFLKSGYWVLEQLSKPDNDDIAQTMFDLLTKKQQQNLYNYIKKKSTMNLKQNYMKELFNIYTPMDNLIIKKQFKI